MDETCESQLLVRLMTQHHQALFRYVHALLGNAEDANDVLQETSVALFGKLDQFDHGRPFLPWAYRFAYLEVLKWREKNSHRPSPLDPDVVELLAKSREAGDDLLQQRTQVLPDCFRLLPEKDSMVMRARYFDRTPVDEIAVKLKMSRRTLFREFERIRRVLLDCIESKLTSEEI